MSEERPSGPKPASPSRKIEEGYVPPPPPGEKKKGYVPPPPPPQKPKPKQAEG